jgi:hypothetical protein
MDTLLLQRKVVEIRGQFRHITKCINKKMRSFVSIYIFNILLLIPGIKGGKKTQKMS